MEYLYIVQIKDYQKHATFAIRTLDERPSMSITDKLIYSSERMFHKDCDLKGSVKKSLVVNLKGLCAKTKCLALICQSYSNFDLLQFVRGLQGFSC
jgi:hypothetical protein